MQAKSAIQVKQASWHDSEAEIRRIRTAVFVEEQNVPMDLDFDGLDAQCIHWLAYVNNIAVGTGRLLADGHFGRMAVLKSHRKQGIGDGIMRAVIKTATADRRPQIYLHAQLTALRFYSGLGFVQYGEEFMDADMPHIAMRLKL